MEKKSTGDQRNQNQTEHSNPAWYWIQHAILLPSTPNSCLCRHLYLIGIWSCSVCLSTGIIQVTKTVKEAAMLSCDYNISTEELKRVRIYWQKDNEMVLAVMSGKVTVWPRYENRTITDVTSNLCIVILALRLSDNGTYTCVIQKPEKGSYKLKHRTSVKLMVRGQWNFLIFSKPADSWCP